MQSINISIIQADLIWENKEANLNTLESNIFSLIKGTKLAILPEMFSTGFSMNTAELAEEMNGPTIVWMSKWAKKKSIYLCGSLIIKEYGHYYNRLILMSPRGEIVEVYDKRHLFSMAEEEKHYSPGNNKLIWDISGFKIAFYICYDLRFPVWLRNTEQVDAMVFVANWPSKRIHHWNTLLQARAIENQVYVFGCNRVGVDGSGHTYSGESKIISPSGEILFNLPNNKGIISCEMQRSEITKVRRYMPFLNDADKFDLKLN